MNYLNLFHRPLKISVNYENGINLKGNLSNQTTPRSALEKIKTDYCTFDSILLKDSKKFW